MCVHECKCRECHPEVFPECSPRTPGYKSVYKHSLESLPNVVRVNGKKLDSVTEALSGEKGWAIYHSMVDGDPDVHHRCSCRHGICNDVAYGDVEFEYNASRTKDHKSQLTNYPSSLWMEYLQYFRGSRNTEDQRKLQTAIERLGYYHPEWVTQHDIHGRAVAIQLPVWGSKS